MYTTSSISMEIRRSFIHHIRSLIFARASIHVDISLTLLTEIKENRKTQLPIHAAIQTQWILYDLSLLVCRKSENQFSFLSVFSVCVFSLCFLSVFSLCVFSVCVFCLCFLSVFSLCVFSVCVFCLCLLSGSLIPDAFPRKTRLA